MVMMKAIWLNFVWHLIQPQGSSKSGEESTDSGSALNTLSNTPESPVSRKPASDHRQPPPPPQMDAAGGIDSPRISGSQSHPAAKLTPEKVCFTFSYSWLILPKTQEKKKVASFIGLLFFITTTPTSSRSLSYPKSPLSHIPNPKNCKKDLLSKGNCSFWLLRDSLIFILRYIIKA